LAIKTLFGRTLARKDFLKIIRFNDLCWLSGSTCTIHFDRWLAFYSGYPVPKMILGEPFVISARPISF
jgi:hypothetical protein